MENTLIATQLRNERKSRINSLLVPMTIMVSLCASTLIFGDDTQLAAVQTKADSIMEQIYNILFALASGAYALVMLIGLLIRIFSSNQKSAEGATQWMKRATVAYVCILALGKIITVIKSLTSGFSYTWGA